MGAENEQKTDPEGTKTEPTPPAGEGEGSEGGASPAAEGQGEGEGEVTDKHGLPGINREKYNRDMKAKDDEIAALKAQLEEKSKTEEGRAELNDKIDKLQADMAEERTVYELKLAGVRDDKAIKAAKAMLPDYEGNVAKLKEDCPYLFSETQQTGSTGLKPGGGAGGKSTDEKIDEIFGV